MLAKTKDHVEGIVLPQAYIMYVCMYVCVYVCMYQCMCMYLDACIHAWIHFMILNYLISSNSIRFCRQWYQQRQRRNDRTSLRPYQFKFRCNICRLWHICRIVCIAHHILWCTCAQAPLACCRSHGPSGRFLHYVSASSAGWALRAGLISAKHMCERRWVLNLIRNFIFERDQKGGWNICQL